MGKVRAIEDIREFIRYNSQRVHPFAKPLDSSICLVTL